MVKTISKVRARKFNCISEFISAHIHSFDIVSENDLDTSAGSIENVVFIVAFCTFCNSVPNREKIRQNTVTALIWSGAKGWTNQPRAAVGVRADSPAAAAKTWGNEAIRRAKRAGDFAPGPLAQGVQLLENIATPLQKRRGINSSQGRHQTPSDPAAI